MANTKSSKKFSIKSKIQRKHNLSKKSMLRTFIRKVNSDINRNDATHAIVSFVTMQKIIDRQTIKGLIHKNRAARYKSNLFKRIKNMISHHNSVS